MAYATLMIIRKNENAEQSAKKRKYTSIVSAASISVRASVAYRCYCRRITNAMFIVFSIWFSTMERENVSPELPRYDPHPTAELSVCI